MATTWTSSFILEKLLPFLKSKYREGCSAHGVSGRICSEGWVSLTWHRLPEWREPPLLKGASLWLSLSELLCSLGEPWTPFVFYLFPSPLSGDEQPHRAGWKRPEREVAFLRFAAIPCFAENKWKTGAVAIPVSTCELLIPGGPGHSSLSD